MKPEHVQVAATLRRMREEARATRDEAASVLGCTRSKIGDLETGRSKPKPAELERLLDHYGIIGPERDELIEFARTSRTRRKPGNYASTLVPATVRRAIDLEAQATSTIFFSSELIPGLLQVPTYTKALLEWAFENQSENIAKLLEVRAGRAAVLTRAHRPPLRYWCILGEAALRSNIGGPKVMCEQIEHLVRLSRTLRNLTVQILPLGSGPHAFLGITVTVHRFPPPAPDMLILEGYGREVMVRHEPTELCRVARHLDLLRTMAHGLEDSTAFMERVHREISELGDS